MNTSALKRFAQQARNILKSGVAKQLLAQGYDPKTKQFSTEPQAVFGGALMGDKMIDDPMFIPKWKALQKAVRSKGAEVVYEEAAYTWFNRLMAIRILEKNGYIAPQLKFVSQQVKTPILIQAARQGNAPRLDAPQRKQLERLLDDDRLETELFTLLITAYCHQNDLLQRVFGRFDDYTELLLPADILASNGFLNLLNNTDAITDDDYRQVELIGWLYQFYISEKKDEVFKSFKNKKKAEAADIPAATQIFTPNWIVKYMVQNTVGRIWLDLNPDSRLRGTMKYLVNNSESEATIGYRLKTTHFSIISEVAHLKLLDPACGSGHILVEGFDLLYSMYREEGYSASEAVKFIFQHNLFGLDIDIRAAQLSTFALLLKAAVQDRTVLEKGILPQVYAMPEKEIFTRQEVLDFLGEANATHADTLYNALELMQQSQNLGSIMKFNFSDQARTAITQQTTTWRAQQPTDLLQEELWKRLAPYMQVLQVLMAKYEAVAANPPYMGSGNMNDSLKEYVNSKYPKSKSDLFSVFMEVCINFCQPAARMGMINMHSWMFLSSFEALRKFIIETYHIENMLHLGPRTFDELSGEVVQNSAFVLRKMKLEETGIYYRLVDAPNCTAKEIMFLNNENRFSNISQSNFEKIQGSPIAYWLSDKLIGSFKIGKPLKKIKEPRQGMATTNNALFLRFWWEVSGDCTGFNIDSKENSILSGKKWIPYSKGGGFRRWYGNHDYLVNFENDGKTICDYIDSTPGVKVKSNGRIINRDSYYKPALTWSLTSSTFFGVRYRPQGFIFDVNGMSLIYSNEIEKKYLLGFFNSKVCFELLKTLNPTMAFQKGDIEKLPIITNLIKDDVIIENTVDISKSDWDSRETSWDFEKHSLINVGQTTLESAYQAWEEQVSQDFYQLHANETELNRIFIDIYGLQDELTPEVKLKDITILQEELDSKALGDATEPIGKLHIKQDVVMRQLISYLMGCLMGRYRLDKPGLHIAHPTPTAEETAAYSYNGHTIEIDDDGIIPLMDNNSSFADNALIRIKHLLEVQWGGDKQLVDTINYLQSALGKDLESYLVKDFWKDHCSRYQKRPIYWLFASPKGAFQVITYMHRMNKYTVEKIRSNYLLRHISNLENRIAAYEADQSSLDRTQMRDLEKLKSDLIECREYDLQLKEVADEQIEFDLDDGVVVNYAKFGNVVAQIK